MTPAPIRRPLTEGWRLRSSQPHPRVADLDIAATVPGCVHTDLLCAGLIPDPFIDDNEHAVAWVADADWVYSTSFDLAGSIGDHDRIDLVFDGLDTLATITLNDVLLGETANMHRRHRFDITDAVRDRANVLTITFRSATRHAQALHAAAAPWPSASFGRPYNYVRKMACSWGWDWGPALTTAGIWKPVSLHGWSAARFQSVRPSASIAAADQGAVTVVGAIERVDDAPLSVRATLGSGANGERLRSIDAVVTESGATELVIDAGRVERWWPRGYGAQPLYTLELELLNDVGDVVDTWSSRIGFRSVRVDTSADATGSAFTLVVNDLPIFAKGVNWIPDDPFPSRITPLRYRSRLEAAVDANVDLVRVWGGGLYESDDFYDACDELGLLVWQDFCFACAAYPEELLATEVEAEARDNVERLMPHPSLVLWNGNNENIWGWFDWGWQRPLAGRSWGAGFYFDVLPRIVAEIDPARPYWPGSPYSGSMHVAANADAHGCTHLWDVWNRLDFDRYRDHTPRFVSEFGWQAPPTWDTLRSSITDDPLTPTSPGMRNHQKADDGDRKLRRGLRAHVGVPDGFDQWWWATQLMQARAVTTGIEHLRSLRGTCMGAVWWQLNDCWPVTSWSVIDSSGQPKPAWYALQAAYRPRLLTIQPRGASLFVFAVNDTRENWSVNGVARRLAFDGTVLAAQPISLWVNGSAIANTEITETVSSAADPSRELLVFETDDDRCLWWFLPDKDLAYERPRLRVEQMAVEETSLSIAIRTDSLVRDLAIMPDRVVPGARCDRQLITLLPGEQPTVTVTGLPPGQAMAVEELTATPVLWSAYSAVHGPD